ncbi:hypothetical protein K501DRAFT_332854 [Backusella circina FSU 941]|nr:hypothetical protein K501DRAFT_332854 [Backusella circina FSU 941]
MSQFTRPTFDVDDSVPEHQPSAQTYRQKPPSFGSRSSNKSGPSRSKKQSVFAQRRFDVDDEDLERLQEEFFANRQEPSARVVRKEAGSSTEKTGKKPSLFAQRKMASKAEAVNMPALEDPNMPTLEDPSMPALEGMPALESSSRPVVVKDENGDEYEPVMDPNPEPHVPVTKKMLDLTSMLGQVLGEITEHKVDKVTAPTLPSFPTGKPGREERAGFPQPVHRSEFKRRLEAKKKQTKTRLETPPAVLDENEQRINEMSQEELDAAREEIMNTLSPESIALLMGGLKKKKKEDGTLEKPVKQEEEKKTVVKRDNGEEEDLVEMKKTYFEDVPLEADKLAWLDERFDTSSKEKDEKVTDDSVPTEEERIYRTLRFDLHGEFIDGTADIPRHKGLHHHGDEPDKAGYTLSELFYLSRSQVPSQRALVWTTLARIIEHAKERKEKACWPSILQVFLGKEHQAAIYIRSALDDRHLNVLSSAIQALSLLLLDSNDSWDEEIKEIRHFNQFLGHVVHPTLPQGVESLPRKGLNEKLTEMVDRVRQSSGLSTTNQEEQGDAALAERDLVRGLIKMGILPRLRYLLHLKSSELMQDRISVERLVRILVRMASAGADVSEAIMQEEDLLESILQWGLVDTEWPMMEAQDEQMAYPSLAAVRLLTVLAQAKRINAEMMVEKATVTLRFLVVSPECHTSLKERAYALQLETLRLVCVLSCYGLIVPTLEDLREAMLTWLRAAIQDPTDTCIALRAATALRLLQSLLDAAADPHKTTPPHAIDWHQPTAYLPAVTAIVRSVSPQNSDLYNTALGYLATWAKYIDLFPPESDAVNEVWKAVTVSAKQPPSYTTQSILCYIQFIDAYASIRQPSYVGLVQEAKKRLACVNDTMMQDCYNKDVMGRYAFWLWLQHHDNTGDKEKKAMLECGVEASKNRGETWLAQQFLQCSLRNVTHLGLFYFEHSEQDEKLSKALFEHDGRHVDSFMLTGTTHSSSSSSNSSSSSTTFDIGAFIMSPIDAVYHLDKSTVAQQCSTDAATIVRETLELSQIFDTDLDIATVTLMKVFLIGDREGRNADVEGEREVFWEVSMESLLDRICSTRTTLHRLEDAWRRSSEYIRQAQVPFYQFYQAFVAHYASVSLGHHGFARLLVYLVTQIDTVDYRHLLFSDYRDAIRSIRLGKDEVPMSSSDVELFSKAGIQWGAVKPTK